MRKVMVAFNTVEEVAAFVKDMSRFPEEVHIDLVSGRHIVSGTSLLGILSLDLSKPVEVKVTSNSDYVYIKDDVYKVLFAKYTVQFGGMRDWVKL